MKITVVICTYNRADLLLRTIDSINRAERPEGADLSILVVANACTDATTDRLDAYRQHIKNANGLPLRYLEEKTPGKSHALNRAIHEIDDGYICFIDDDHRLDRGYLLAVVEAIEKHPEITLFCGRVIPDWQGDEPQWLHEKGKYRLYPSPVPNFDLGREVRHLSAETPLPGGGNLIVARGVFQRTGGFSTRFGPRGGSLFGSEDSDFVLRALNSGEKMLYQPAILQYHYVDPARLTMAYLLAKSFQRNRSMTLAYNPGRSWVPVYLWKKLLLYALRGISCFDRAGVRFYATRCASILGEMAGHLQAAE